MLEFMPQPLSPLFETTYLPLMDKFGRKLAREYGLIWRGTAPVVADARITLEEQEEGRE